MWITVNSRCPWCGTPLSLVLRAFIFLSIGTCVWFGRAERVWFPSSSVLLCFVFFLFFLLRCTSCDAAGSLVTEKLYAIWEPARCVSESVFLSRRFVCQQTEAGSPRSPWNPVMGVWYACKHTHNRLFVFVFIHAKSLKFGKYLTLSAIRDPD